MADPYRDERARLKAQILARVGVGGLSLRAVEAAPGMPCGATIRAWGRADPVFRDRLDAALARRARRAQVRALRAGPAPRPARMRRRGGKTPQAWDQAVADAVLIALVNGAQLKTIHRSHPGLPGRTLIARWRREQPDFDLEVRAAIRHGMRRHGRAAQACAGLEARILEGLLAGGSLLSLSRAPGMPEVKTLYRWMRQRPEFRRKVEQACQDREDWYVDQVGALARTITVANHVAVGRQISALQRQLGRLTHRPGSKRR